MQNKKPAISLCFQVHHPIHIRPFTFFDLGKGESYIDLDATLAALSKRINHSYLPANKLMLKMIEEFKDEFQISFIMSGTTLDALVDYFPQALNSFQNLAEKGNVEFLAHPYDHSLSFMIDRQAFLKQLDIQALRIKRYFGKRPNILCNTALIHHNHLGYLASKHKLQGIIIPSLPDILNGRNSNQLFCPPDVPNLPLLLRDSFLSDALNIHFTDVHWEHYPLYADTYASWFQARHTHSEVIPLIFDYHLFGGIHDRESGIFEFFYHFVSEILKNKIFQFLTPSQVVQHFQVKDTYDVGQFVSMENGIETWFGNNMQKDVIEKLYALQKDYIVENQKIQTDLWSPLYQADHFQLMKLHSPNASAMNKNTTQQDDPYEKYVVFCNILADMKLKLQDKLSKQHEQLIS